MKYVREHAHANTGRMHAFTHHHNIWCFGNFLPLTAKQFEVLAFHTTAQQMKNRVRVEGFAGADYRMFSAEKIENYRNYSKVRRFFYSIFPLQSRDASYFSVHKN